MVVPVVDEAVWAPALAGLPVWQPPAVRTCVLAPHPDDESLAAGGLIAHLRERNVSVSLVAVTDGEACYPGETDLPQRRIPEQVAALERLGVPATAMHRLHLRDGGVTRQEEELAARLEPLLRDAEHIVAPWPHDYHPDHEATGRAAQAIADRHGIPLTWYFFWTWHRGTPDVLAGKPLVKLPLTSRQMQAKRDAILCHCSQLAHPSGEPILPVDILEPAWRAFEIFLPA